MSFPFRAAIRTKTIKKKVHLKVAKMFSLLIFPPPLTLLCAPRCRVYSIQSGFQCAQLAADVFYSNSFKDTTSNLRSGGFTDKPTYGRWNKSNISHVKLKMCLNSLNSSWSNFTVYCHKSWEKKEKYLKKNFYPLFDCCCCPKQIEVDYNTKQNWTDELKSEK